VIHEASYRTMAPTPPVETALLARDRPHLIALVEDDPCVRDSLRRVLRLLGFAVEAYASAEALLDSADLGQIDCLLLDVHLPGMSGPRLKVELVRSGVDVPAVFISGAVDPGIMQGIRRRGDTLLHKPLDAELLATTLREAIARRH